MNECGMDSIFIVFIFWTGLTGLSGFFSPAARGLSAGGRFILTILLIQSTYFFKIGIHSSFSFKFYSFFLDSSGRLFASGPALMNSPLQNRTRQELRHALPKGQDA